LFGAPFMSRGEEFGGCCPNVDDIELPADDDDWGEDGLPNSVDVILRGFKGHWDEEYRLTLHRNCLNTRYCPVFNLGALLAVTGMRPLTVSI
jgi:hypothetical protein